MSESDSKVIVITGATRGLGLAMTHEFIKKGHIVMGCGRSQDQIEQLQNTYEKPHQFKVVDVANFSQVQTWTQNVLEEQCKIDFLINNAAIINSNNPLWRVPVEEFSQLIDINIKGTFHTIATFLPSMSEKKSGVIVNISSGWGRSTSPDVAPYCTSKWAIEGMTQALSQEIPRGLAAVALNPGIIHTKMLQSCFGSESHHYPTPEKWSKKAVKFILNLSLKDNGKALSCP